MGAGLGSAGVPEFSFVWLLNTAFPGAGSGSHRCACDSGLGVPQRNTRALWSLLTALSLVAMVPRTVLERDVSHLTVSEVCARPFPGLPGGRS